MLFIVLKKSANLILDMLLISVMLIKKTNVYNKYTYIYILYRYWTKLRFVKYHQSETK